MTAKAGSLPARNAAAATPPTRGAVDTEAAAPQTPPISTYTVKPGDTLWSIALQFGTDVPSLELANKLNARSLLQPGEKLTVLNQVGWIWLVSPGETLSNIAATTGCGVSAIAQANGLTSSALQAGQRLLIPNEPSAGQLEGITTPKVARTSASAAWVVRPGDSLSLIASTEGVSLAALEAANGLNAHSILRVGERLALPGGAVATAARPSARATRASSGVRLRWPVPTSYPITSPFGWRPNPWGPGRDFHHGIDIGVPLRTPVRAACSGVVRVASWVSGFRGGYGNAVEILCNSGPLTLYAHNTRLVVHVGEDVAAGQLISYSGSTGNSTGPHLHFGVRINGSWQNPLTFLPPR